MNDKRDGSKRRIPVAKRTAARGKTEKPVPLPPPVAPSRLYAPSPLIGYEPIDEATVRDWTDKLRSAERGLKADEMAREMIRDFSLCVWAKAPLHRHLLMWLVDALGSILEHKDPHEARD